MSALPLAEALGGAVVLGALIGTAYAVVHAFIQWWDRRRGPGA